MDIILVNDQAPGEHRNLVQRFHDDVYRQAFPNIQQAEGPDTWLPLLTDPGAGQPRVYIALSRSGSGAILGGVVFERYAASYCWLVTYIAVHPTARGQGVARGLMDRVNNVRSSQDGADNPMFAETESPFRILDADIRANAVRRLSILHRLDFRYVPVSYVQPALAPDKQEVEDLILLLHGECAVPANKVDRFLTEFYTARGQRGSPSLLRARAQLGAIGSLQTEPLMAWYTRLVREMGD